MDTTIKKCPPIDPKAVKEIQNARKAMGDLGLAIREAIAEHTRSPTEASKHKIGLLEAQQETALARYELALRKSLPASLL